MMRRRTVLSIAPLALAAASGQFLAAEPAGPALPQPARTPSLEFIYECEVTLADTIDFGPTLEGHRRIIPITGGWFRGPKVKGQVVSGGSDWNLERADGTGSVEAAYYLRTDDGVLIRIVNKGTGEPRSPAGDSGAERFFMFTSPTFEAPKGKYEWMNQGTFVGTLGARREQTKAVLIRVFKVIL
jgi:hypothetical protein